MTVELTVEKDFAGEKPPAGTAKEVLECMLDLLGCPYEAAITLLLTDDEAIREINRENRAIDAATDVLSFPYQNFEKAGDFAFLEEHPEAFDPESGELILGDIVISVDHALKQAAEYGHPLLREYAFLIAHSILHLCGYDHETPEEAAVMEALQKKGLDSIGITR